MIELVFWVVLGANVDFSITIKISSQKETNPKMAVFRGGHLNLKFYIWIFGSCIFSYPGAFEEKALAILITMRLISVWPFRFRAEKMFKF